MKINKALAAAILVFSLLSIAVASQIKSPAIQELEDCKTTFYDELQPIYGTCFEYFNRTSCINDSGPGTGCSTSQASINYTCITSEQIVQKNSTKCTSLNRFIVSITKKSSVEQKEIDFSQWGACIQEAENDCIIVTCVSKYDGAHNGKFTGCNGGKSCQKFEICSGSIKSYYKNSREGFAEKDPTFRIPKLEIKEVGQ
ncbi:hypothetical protein HYS31_03675 [Candidatus Woesearchaeota archaeon]|nr:hypothetical protein [Candidatus Woesearchaeota archaeon]